MRRTALFGSLLVVAVCLALAPAAQADTVNAGPIQLVIGPGPVHFPGFSTTVIMQGGPGPDLVINVNGNGNPPLTVPIEIVALSLQSVAPVTIGSSFFDVFVEIDLGAPQSTGTTNFNSNGTFDSFFDVFVEITFRPVGGGQDIIQTELIQMQLHGLWTPGPNVITGTITCQGQSITNCQLPVSLVPEPATLVLFGSGLAAVWVRRRKRFRI